MKKQTTTCEPDPTLKRDLRTLAWFIQIYCENRHPEVEKSLPRLRGYDLDDLGVRAKPLCAACTKLLLHAFVKRAHCPFSDKPPCKHCQSHCYQPAYRRQIREVMRYSGKRLVLSGRLDMLFRLLF
ncbi:MAG: nitrous oxide-stimulated promoter family protein [Phycisphaerae bacterium]